MQSMETTLTGAFGLAGKAALITGGGSGLGLAMARCLVAAGARVALTGRREGLLQEACRALGPSAIAIPHDVTDTAAAARVAAEAASQLGGLDILINNAGLHCKKPFDTVETQELGAVLDVHVRGAYALTQAVLPHLRVRGGGSVIMISSESAVTGLTQVSAYAAAKAAMLGLVRSLSGELSGEGIRVNAIIPGFIDTPMFRQATDADPARREKILGHTPMRCFGDPADIGWAAVYLCSAAARFVTGIELTVDGGFRIGF